MAEKPKVLVIVGPTASGKTGLAIELAKQFDGEVISADSRQVYRGLDIGTEKVTKEEMRGVSHHLIDIVEAEQVYTAADFKRDSAAAIEDIAARGKLPIVAGGTFFYIDTLLGRVSTPEVPPNEELRAELAEKSAAELHKQLQQLDPRRAGEIDRDNPRRLIRAIEIATALGYVPETTLEECPYDVLTIGIETDREELRARIRARAANALDRGLVKETSFLLEPKSYFDMDSRTQVVTRPALSRERLSEIGLEYREVLWYKDTQQSKQNLIDRLEQVTWQYAKRQLTWLKRDDSIKWFRREEIESIAARVHGFLD